MKTTLSKFNFRRKVTTGLIIIGIGILVAYLFYNTGIVEMVLDIFSPYPEK
ncbi:hypothetical protein M0D21_05165 [Aquimarina sp. D1M17]|uniref:hypothetical protein n=1 Tax=Aquimarina acroporae TaxID=2937283 RepID=UPI0020C0FE23|nr:hypothetical protein [Aquimarina acroporae]MCK8520943.1 hypothetical protein [Aquimarina acroporae]